MKKLITIENISKKNRQGLPILNEINASIMEGELITIIGPSGSGKSTFLSLINRMTGPDSGALFFKNTAYLDMDVLKLRRKIGMVFQLPTMLPGTVRDNLLVGPKLFQQELSELEIEALLEQVGLSKSMKNQDARSLSGGQKQRVSLARTLANKPEVLLLDEVTASLDPNSSEEIEKMIQLLHQQEAKTILWVTHNLSQAKKVGQSTWVLTEGNLIEQGATSKVFNQPTHAMTKQFIATSFTKEEPMIQ